MAVDRKFRRQGHASRLIEVAEAIALKSGFEEVYLHLLYNFNSVDL